MNSSGVGERFLRTLSVGKGGGVQVQDNGLSLVSFPSVLLTRALTTSSLYSSLTDRVSPEPLYTLTPSVSRIE